MGKQAICDRFNTRTPVGTEVIVLLDSGEQKRTRTRSEAYLSNSGHPVVFLEGVRGYYLLNRVKPAPEATTRVMNAAGTATFDVPQYIDVDESGAALSADEER